jgi:GT2 family glycosyltransferase
LPPTTQRIAGSWRGRSASLTSSYPASRLNPRVGAVAIPYIKTLQTNQVVYRTLQPQGLYATAAFVTASHDILRDVFLEAGGYREIYFYAGEEGDLCIRMLQKGFVVRVGRADPIHHCQSSGRASFLIDF